MRWTILDRGWWRPKPGRVLTQGRIIHALIGLSATLAVGWLWEAASPLFRWRHPWGDVIDFLAFEAGQIAGVVIALCLRTWAHA